MTARRAVLVAALCAMPLAVAARAGPRVRIPGAEPRAATRPATREAFAPCALAEPRLCAAAAAAGVPRRGLQAIVLTEKEFSKSVESITNWKDTKSSNNRYAVLPIVNSVVKEAMAQMDTVVDEDGGGKKKGRSLINEGSDRRISVICFPLAAKKRALGVHLTNGPQGFRENDLLFITNRRSHADLAIENILLREKERGSKEALVNARDELERKVKERTSELMKANRKLKELAITDDLTGLFNHRHFLRELEASEYRRALRYGRSLALLLLDVDHFKILNDRYGHSCGDFVLNTLAGLLKGCLRRSTTRSSSPKGICTSSDRRAGLLGS